MPAAIILGGQWGDEGKGKITDALAPTAAMVVRANGGSNAGHTVETPDGVFKMHLVPSGILNPDCICVIGAGVVIDPIGLANELTGLEQRGVDTRNLLISDRAHVVLPFHMAIDRYEETLREERSIGTTLRGIGPAYADKVSRRGLRVGDLLDAGAMRQTIEHQLRMHGQYLESAETDIDAMLESLSAAADKLGPSICAAEQRVQDTLDAGKRVLVECAQGVMLDIDYGTYPYVTSSSPSAAGACQGAGIAPMQVDRVIGVFKAYSTRVGSGPMPTELHDDTGELIRKRGREYGTTTGRPRRTGWFDAVAARSACRLNGVSEIALTLTDVFDVFPEISVATSYQWNGQPLGYVPANLDDYAAVVAEYQTTTGWLQDITGARRQADLPAGALAYVRSIGDATGVEVSMMGVGPAREQLIHLQ
ncbi:MAG: adenylosuccinate synthase [Thermomicrobiales bacterium]|nr:adenylosuccinate synthase [Thermomicrobiales bacterium]